ncbi:MAG: ATP synthase F1 subunit delta [Eubacteriales bacterium]|nr:ATP synthase F1 subunit delta [Eubacteriales bacterium]
MAKLVSKTYGDALFDLALEENSVDAMAEEVQAVQAAFAENPSLAQLLANPDIAKEEKLSLVENIFKGRVSDNLVGFLRIIVDKQRYSELDAILDYCMARVKEYRKIGIASVASPFELSQEWKDKIEKKLLETTGYVKMEMTYRVEPELIGGLVIRIGDTVVDSSVRNKLTDIGRGLMKASLDARADGA